MHSGVHGTGREGREYHTNVVVEYYKVVQIE
jgi:hypothetical protein